MLGLLGGLIFGGIFTGAWIGAEQAEQKQKNNSQENNRDFYFDKSGHMRHTKTNKKFTPEEIHQFYNPVSMKEKMEKIDKDNYDKFAAIYWYVYNHDNRKIVEVFLTEQDAKEYVLCNYSDGDNKDYWKTIRKTSKSHMELEEEWYGTIYHLNF